MTTRINFGLHNSSEDYFSFENTAKVIGYNFLCAKRHFEHAFAETPEVFIDGKWQLTSSENVVGKGWHIVLGCIELLPIIGHIVALVEKIFGKTVPLPLIIAAMPEKKEEPKETPSKVENTKTDLGNPSSSLQNNIKPEEPPSSPQKIEPEVKIDKSEENKITINSEYIANKYNWLPEPMSDRPAASPFKEWFFNDISSDLPGMKELSETESKALATIRTLTQLLGLTKPLSELPKFPLKLDSALAHMTLFSVNFMNDIDHPISFDFDGDGWPFVVIKVLDAQNLANSRPILLSCGPRGSHCVEWHGWWEEHVGQNHPTFFSQCEFIDPIGELTKYSETTIQRFKNLLAGQEVEDAWKHKWILASSDKLTVKI